MTKVEREIHEEFVAFMNEMVEVEDVCCTCGTKGRQLRQEHKPSLASEFFGSEIDDSIWCGNADCENTFINDKQ